MILDRFRSFTFNRCNLHKDILSHSTTSRAYCHESSLSLKAIQYPFPSTKYIFPNNQMIYIPILFRVESTRLSYCGSGFGHHGMSIHCKFREVILPKVHHSELLVEWTHQFLKLIRKCNIFQRERLSKVHIRKIAERLKRYKKENISETAVCSS